MDTDDWGEGSLGVAIRNGVGEVKVKPSWMQSIGFRVFDARDGIQAKNYNGRSEAFDSLGPPLVGKTRRQAPKRGLQYSTIELGKEDMKFSAAHYTVFSATSRERLHGHTHAVRVSLTGPVSDEGMVADYAVFKKLVRKQCDEWDERLLAPSPQIPALVFEVLSL